MNPLGILNKAIEKVPFIKYALGIAGIAAAVSIISDLRLENSGYPIVPIILTFFLMILLAIVVSIASGTYEKASKILVYFVLAIIMISSTLTISSVFGNWPINRWELTGILSNERDNSHCKFIYVNCVGHSSGSHHDGHYFNFDSKEMDEAIGNEDWSRKQFKITQFRGAMKVEGIALFRRYENPVSTCGGTAFGSWISPRARSYDWQVGDKICIQIE